MAKQQINSGQQKADFIQLHLSANQTIGSSNIEMAFTTVASTMGNSFTRSGSTVVIGAGVSMIRVTYNVMTESAGSTSYLYSNLHKNGVEQSQTIDGGPSAAFRSTSATRIIPVASGDVIRLMCSSGANTQVARAGIATYLLVERVA